MIGVNDKGLVDSDGKFFKNCKVFFRDKKYSTILKKINLSQLINISFTKTKKEIICYCDGIIVESEIKPVNGHHTNGAHLSSLNGNGYHKDNDEKPEEIKVDIAPIEDVVMNREISTTFLDTPSSFKKEYLQNDGVVHVDIINHYDRSEQDFETYHSDAIRWVISNCPNDQRLLMALKGNYNCGDQYAKIRMQSDLPDFSIIEHNTYFYQCDFPTQEALIIEDIYNKFINSKFKKYRMRTRIALISELDGKKLDEEYECLMILNYLHQVDIFAPIKMLIPIMLEEMEKEQLSGRQQQC